MSKSKGDILTVSKLEEQGYNPLVYRMFCLQSHYRKPLEFSYEILDNMKISYEKLKNSVARVKANASSSSVDDAAFNDFKGKFTEALGNDLNTSMAFTVLYDMLKADISDATKVKLVEDFDQVLCLDLLKEEEAKAVDSELESYILKRIEDRVNAKKAKDFATADAIRDELAAKGIIIKDTREGTTWTIQ